MTRLGFNYRLANVAAAIGLAQLERFEWHVERRRANAARYRAQLEGQLGIEMARPLASAESVDWLTSVVLRDRSERERDRVMLELERAGIETRPLFPPLHRQMVFSAGPAPSLPVAEGLSSRGLSLPSGAALCDAQIDDVCDELLRMLV